MNTEYYSELICDPSRGWVYLGGVKPLWKFPQDPKKSTVVSPKPYPQHAPLPTARPLRDLQKRGGPRAGWAPCTPTPHPLCLPRHTHNRSLRRRSPPSLKVRFRHGIFTRGENNADFKSECQETTRSPGRLRRARAERGFTQVVTHGHTHAHKCHTTDSPGPPFWRLKPIWGRLFRF